MKKINVLVIDDSAFMRKMISEILSSDDRIKVVGTARNGKDGLAKIKQLSPDVVTLDIEMPILDGISTLQEIMKTNPLPVVMVSSITSRGAMKTIHAISKGAVDFIAKPSGAISLNISDIKDEMIQKVITASEAKLMNVSNLITNIETNEIYLTKKKTMIAIGTSTGGPSALEQVLRTVPEHFPAPILIVQHMPPHFTKSLAERLNLIANITVKEARNGDIVENGTAYIAPGDFHMTVRKVGRSIAIHLHEKPPKNGHRPSVDVLFRSIAHLEDYNKIAVVLTGMGRDGASGISYLKEQDDQTIVITESKESAVVYGMPLAVARTGKVNITDHISNIGKTIEEIVQKNKPR